ncbi:phosphoadenosine phosphosulfate reductase family protein (plasmid) [Halopseudomonas sp. SMJS2]|uniref:phosphoadenosine phosphosulfate reductase domain-containing protein n=1 Tax=Halopseudomonas sp. SMJS2 TaxID=3041098 RepID=UPI002452F1E2|nr:phosphoadenosine phosphosulfate reductase family protein [Halopseudomonas sp. SMJS2]WGK63460.1 phosphoadenosine phosphosulfate reductase family protein [Halopseudomonas sp. SMJS2]
MGRAEIFSIASEQAVLFVPVKQIDVPPDPSKAQLSVKVRIAVDAIKSELRQGYHPLVSCSFGKDSSVTLSLTLLAILELKLEGFNVPTLHVLHSDTKLENVVVHAYNQSQIRSLRAFADSSGIDIKVWVTSPTLSNDYLVSIIGGRTIASVGSNTKCSSMMKVAPLSRQKKAVMKWIAEKEGISQKQVRALSLIGTRLEESTARGQKMTDRGESATQAVRLNTSAREYVLSVVANFTTMDIFEYIGWVRSGKISTYSDFDQLVEIYRDLNNGDCMVTAYLANKEAARPPCSARTGCWICTRVSRDESAENMLNAEDGSFAWTKPLNDLRNFIRAYHFNPQTRNWLGRSVNTETGTVSIAPNSYSPQMCLALLQMVLSIQAKEFKSAWREGREPRFELLTIQQIIGIDLLWGRYGYQRPFTAIRQWIEIMEQGKRYSIPSIEDLPTFTEHDVSFRGEAPFGDEHFFGTFSGLRNVEHATADCESTKILSDGTYVTDANVGDIFEVDEEGAELFWSFERDNALERISLNDAPAAVVHYFLGLGTVTLFKGSHGDVNRMLRMSNQIHRSGLRPHLHDPKKLMEILGATEAKPANTGRANIKQMSIFD